MALRSRITKSQPTLSDVHVNKPLTNISVAYIQRTGFVADQVFPVVPVTNKSDLYYLFQKDDFWRDEAKVRTPATQSAGGGFNITTASYSCSVYAHHKDVSDQIRANADAPINLDTTATEYVTQKLMIRRERQWATSYFQTGVWATDFTPGTLWSAATGSDPLGDVETGKRTVQAATGFVPNTMVIGYAVYSKLRNNAAIRDQFKYTSSDSIDVDMLARFFGLDRIFVATSVYASNNEGATVATSTIVDTNSALLCYSAPAPSLLQPTAGYVFNWTGLNGAVGGIRIKRFRMEEIESDRVEGEMAYAMGVVANTMGYFFHNCVS